MAARQPTARLGTAGRSWHFWGVHHQRLTAHILANPANCWLPPSLLFLQQPGAAEAEACESCSSFLSLHLRIPSLRCPRDGAAMVLMAPAPPSGLTRASLHPEPFARVPVHPSMPDLSLEPSHAGLTFPSFEQVTTYCCHYLQGTEQPATHVLDNGSIVNYTTCSPKGSAKNMLSCFQKATSQHCGDSTPVFPAGLCNSTDTTVAQPGDGTSSSSSNPAHLLVSPFRIFWNTRDRVRGLALLLPLCLLIFSSQLCLAL